MIENYYAAEYLMKRREEQLNTVVHTDWKKAITIKPTQPKRARFPFLSLLQNKEAVCCSATVCC